jgi:hypothetical protein
MKIRKERMSKVDDRKEKKDGCKVKRERWRK